MSAVGRYPYLAAGVAWLLLTLAARAEIRLFVTPPESVAAGAPATAWVFICNDAAQPASVPLPASLALSLRGAGGDAAVTAQRDAAARERVELGPQAFCKVPYLFTWPSALVAPVQAVLVAEPPLPARLAAPAAGAAATTGLASGEPAAGPPDRNVTAALPDRLQL
ncbi:MAG: hypothetical protein IT440_16185, partial [Phycisphaeraceae bacterium]|nr:hypothetical protein [Phycisphaeraceae bacterium]